MPKRLQLIRDIYRRLPQVACRGHCSDSCGPIDMTTVERDNISRKHGVEIPKGSPITGPLTCPALGMMGTCNVYEDRPLICRAYGAARGLECPHGCETDGPPITQAEMFHALADAHVASGDWTRAHGVKVHQLIDRLDRPDGEVQAAQDGTLDRGTLHTLYRHLDYLTGEQLSARYHERAAYGLEVSYGGKRAS